MDVKRGVFATISPVLGLRHPRQGVALCRSLGGWTAFLGESGRLYFGRVACVVPDNNLWGSAADFVSRFRSIR